MGPCSEAGWPPDLLQSRGPQPGERHRGGQRRSCMVRLFRWLALTLTTGVLLAPASLAAQTEPDLSKLPGQEWLTPGGNLGNQRYSSLDQITTSNVSQLKGQWVTHLGSGL